MIDRLSPLRILKATTIALVGSLIGNETIRMLTATTYGISPAFIPLEHGKIVFFTILGTVGAAIVRIAVHRSRQPARLFEIIAVIGLAVSIIPDILILSNPFPGTSLAEVVALMCMHVVTAAICIGVLRLPSGHRQTT